MRVKREKSYNSIKLYKDKIMNITLNNKTKTSILEKRIPFKMQIPNNETLKAMQEVKNGETQEVSFKQLKEDMEKCIIN
jgi:antitoxin component of RelBE/YafQ-DinJ toxin-antitoxin module